MTEMIADPATVRGELDPQQRREEARRMYRESVEAELPMSAEALGRAFGRSARWGRDRIAEVRTHEDASPSVGMPTPRPAADDTEKPDPVPDTQSASDPAGMPRQVPTSPPSGGGMPARRPGTDRREAAATGRQRFVVTALGVLAGVVAGVGTLAVASAGFALSFDAIRAVGQAAYIRPSMAWMLPVCVDGAMAVATVCAVVLRRMGRRPVYPWLVVLAGAGISIAANALHAYQQGGEVPLPPHWAMAVSAVPPLLLAMSVHLLVILGEARRELGRS